MNSQLALAMLLHTVTTGNTLEKTTAEEYANKIEKDLDLLDMIIKLIKSGDIKINEDILADYPELEDKLGL